MQKLKDKTVNQFATLERKVFIIIIMYMKVYHTVPGSRNVTDSEYCASILMYISLQLCCDF